jgi:ferrous iron transport protein B
MVLGFGCDTMATLVTRTLETRRERILCTLLLALAIPCSAQLGVILGLLAGHPGGLLTWGGTVLGVLLAVGFLAARILPGESPLFYMELPPLRRPIASNVLAKTYSRMIWYVREVLPLFLLVSLLLWLGQTTRTFALVLRAMSPALRGMGLPTDAAPAFLLGFFRRDYGAAGLYDLQKAGRLTGNQLTVAAITLTLFLPCVAQFLVMLREHGVRATLAISGFVLAVAYGVGVLVNGLLEWTGTTL